MSKPGLSRTALDLRTATASFYEHRDWWKEQCENVEEDIALLNKLMIQSPIWSEGRRLTVDEGGSLAMVAYTLYPGKMLQCSLNLFQTSDLYV